MFSNIINAVKHIQKLRYYTSSMCVLTPKCVSPICHVLLTAKKKGTAVAVIYGQQKNYWIFIQTKLSRIYRHKSFVTHFALMKRQAWLTI